MKAVMLVGVGGFLGANARYWLGGVVEDYFGGAFPVGTLFVNITGSLLLGILMGGVEVEQVSPEVRLAFAVGFLGAYTTFSTFSYESLRLLESGHLGMAALNMVVSNVLGVAAAVAGLALGRNLS